ncbi:TRAP transporter small permease [Rhodospirillum sp. A1_3_36]|uniref:TRAP transporter small permease n=1 Tax=Rhodospirillum sp. A1_3_36 TaxID=3391666 RepID=UPI0039A45CBB
MINRVLTVLFPLAQILAWVGMTALLGAMSITVLDIILRKIGQGGIPGAVDLVQLTIMWAAFLSIPLGFTRHGHVAVSMVVERFGIRGQAVSLALSTAAACVVMAGIGWFGMDKALQQWTYGDSSLTIGVPMVLYWIPLVVGSTFAALAVFLMFLGALGALVSGRPNPLLDITGKA